MSGVPITSAPLSSIDIISQKISDLEEKMKLASPAYEGLLQTIHRDLSKDESLTHLLTDEQVGIIVAGLKKKKNVTIVEVTQKSKSVSKRLSNTSLDDL